MAAMASAATAMGATMPARPLHLRVPSHSRSTRVLSPTGTVSVARAILERDDGGFGARDPFPEEIASNFGDKVLGNTDTEHLIMVPTLPVLRLAERAIKPVPEGAAPLVEAEAKALLRKVVGWRIVNQGASDGTGLKLQCDWNLKDSAAVDELRARIAKVAEDVNYEYEIQTLENNKVRVEVWTSAIGGLTENDFIFASNIDQVETKDLTRRLRTWF